MNIIILDFETYFDDEYTLKKLSTEEYIRDKRFEAHGVGIKWQTGEMKWLRDIHLLKNELENSAVLCHHAHFDGLILSYHYDIKPAFWLDTLSMARMVHGNHVSASLDSLSKLYNLSGKTVPYDEIKGKQWRDMSPYLQTILANGCLHDCDLTHTIFQKMAVNFPVEEFQLIDLTVRMFTEPVLEGDINLLGEIWYEERARKQNLLRNLGVDAKDLQSSDKFADLLRAEGIEPETKKSPKGNTIFAFAKTDDFMRELRESENERLAGLAEARLGLKSTLNQTRAETMGSCASRGPMPVYLSYCAAHTTRWGGGDGDNKQNLPRNGKLRKAVKAPKGYKICVVDLSQIECRLLNVLAGQQDVIEIFKSGKTPYEALASEFYSRQITKKNDPAEYGTGKQGELSCGYGCGPSKFKWTAKLGVYGPPVELTLEQAEEFVNKYRRKHPNVLAYWGMAGRMIARLAGGEPLEWGPITIRDKRLWLPNGSCIIYDTLYFDKDERQWQYQTRKGMNKLYGAKLCQHVCEALGRIVLGQAALRLLKRGYRMIMTVHDEGLFLIRDEEEKLIILEEFERQVSWLPELPVGAEVVVGDRYEK